MHSVQASGSRVEKAKPSPLSGRLDLVVASNWLDFGEQLSRFWLKDGNRIVGSSKRAHGVERIKQIQDGEFYLSVSIVPQDIPSPVSSDLLAII